MRELFEKLFKCFDAAKMSEYSHFVSMKGCEYKDSNKIKLFVIGRAVNGWTQLCTDSACAFAEAAEAQFQADGFTWIGKENGKFFSKHEESKEARYFLSKSPFWRTIEQIWNKMNDNDFSIPVNARFFDYIAWSNLYKVAPKEGGNPSNCMCKAQLDICREILEAEIEAYKPTHILLITDYDKWFANEGYDFSEIFEEKNRIGSNYKNKFIYVEGTARYRFGEKMIPVVVSCRPERRNEEAFVKAVAGALTELR